MIRKCIVVIRKRAYTYYLISIIISICEINNYFKGNIPMNQQLRKITFFALIAANTYAADTIFSISKTDLNGYAVIRAEVDDNGLKKTTVQNCSNGGYCNITFKNMSINPGLHTIKLYANNSNKKIGETTVDKFANHSGDDVFNIGFAALPASSLKSSSGLANSALDPKDISIRISGVFKVAATLYPGFKPVADVAGGMMDLIIGKGASSSDSKLNEIFNITNQINSQVIAIHQKLTDFNTQYNRDEFNKSTKEINGKLSEINTTLNNLQRHIQSNGNSLTSYLDKFQGGTTTPNSLVSKAIGADRKSITLALEYFINNNGTNLQDFNYKLDNLLAEQSRDNKRVNYISLYNYYNSQYILYFTSILSAVMGVQQLDKMAVQLISSDSKYKDIYRSEIYHTIPGISESNTTAQNQQIVSKYYAEYIYPIILANFSQNKIKDVYGKVGLKFANPNSYISDGMTDFNLLLSKASLNIQSFDGFTLSGIYGGSVALTSWESNNFTVPYTEIKNSTFSVYTDKGVAAYNPNPYSRYFGAGELYFIPTNFQRSHYDGGVHLFTWDHSEKIGGFNDRVQNLRRVVADKLKEGYNHSQHYYDVPVVAANNRRIDSLTTVKSAVDKRDNYEENELFVIGQQKIRFYRPKYNSISGGHHAAPQLTGVYSIKMVSPKDNKTKLYLFGVNYHAWSNNSTEEFPGKFYDYIKYRNNFGWGLTVFCPTFSCQQLKPGYIVYNDGTSISITQKDGKATIVAGDNDWKKYSITTKFPDEYTYYYYSPEIKDIASGSHALVTDGVATMYDPNEIVNFKYTYVMKDNTNGKIDHPTFTLKMENGYCQKYTTSHGKQRSTCVLDKGNRNFEIITK